MRGFLWSNTCIYSFKPAHILLKALIHPNCIVIITKIIRSLNALSAPAATIRAAEGTPTPGAGALLATVTGRERARLGQRRSQARTGRTCRAERREVGAPRRKEQGQGRAGGRWRWKSSGAPHAGGGAETESRGGRERVGKQRSGWGIKYMSGPWWLG
jgi:hypothetical protein